MPAAVKERRTKEKSGISYIEVDKIVPNPAQPRRYFEDEALQELSDSIREYGLINPISVRRRGDIYELVAGERRLRAARMAGLSSVPCMVLDVDLESSGLLALVENLQRRDLNFIEEAQGIYNLINVFEMSQEECARRLGKSQPAVANKLRILKLPNDVLEDLRLNDLSERHGRALLRLPDPDMQRDALEEIIRLKLNVAAAEALVDRMLAGKGIKKKERNKKTRFVLKDVRIFVNTINRGLDVMKQGGIDADMHRTETDDALIFTISIPKKSKAPPLGGAPVHKAD